LKISKPFFKADRRKLILLRFTFAELRRDGKAEIRNRSKLQAALAPFNEIAGDLKR